MLHKMQRQNNDLMFTEVSVKTPLPMIFDSQSPTRSYIGSIQSNLNQESLLATLDHQKIKVNINKKNDNPVMES